MPRGRGRKGESTTSFSIIVFFKKSNYGCAYDKCTQNWDYNYCVFKLINQFGKYRFIKSTVLLTVDWISSINEAHESLYMSVDSYALNNPRLWCNWTLERAFSTFKPLNDMNWFGRKKIRQCLMKVFKYKLILVYHIHVIYSCILINKVQYLAKID